MHLYHPPSPQPKPDMFVAITNIRPLHYSLESRINLPHYLGPKFLELFQGKDWSKVLVKHAVEGLLIISDTCPGMHWISNFTVHLPPVFLTFDAAFSVGVQVEVGSVKVDVADM